MLANPNFNSTGPENEPLLSNNDSWDGVRVYEPFGALTEGGAGGGGGGGGSYIPPVPPNPLFVPPKFSEPRQIKIILSSLEPTEFSENSRALGINRTITKVYSTVNFGSNKTFNANINGKISKNYFTANIQRKYKSLVSINSTLDFAVAPKPVTQEPSRNLLSNLLSNPFARVAAPSLNITNTVSANIEQSVKPTINLTFGSSPDDKLSAEFQEVLSIKEYEIDDKGQYNFINEKLYEGSNITATLNFTFKDRVKAQDPQPPKEDPDIDLGIYFNSDFQNEVGKNLYLKYEIISGQDNGEQLIKSDKISIEDGNNDLVTLDKNVLANSVVNFTIESSLSNEYSLENVYYTSIPVDIDVNFNRKDVSRWKQTNQVFSVAGKELLSKIKVFVTVNKVDIRPVPEVTLKDSLYTIEIKDSDSDKPVNLMFTTENAEFVDVFFEDDTVVRINANQNYANLFFRKDFKNKFGINKVILSPFSKAYGRGRPAAAIINFISVDNFPSVIQITYPTTIDIPSFSDNNIDYEIKYKSYASTTIDVDLILKDKSRVSLYKSITPNGLLKINLKTLANKFPNWNGSDNVTLIFKPYNRSGDRELIGNDYQIVTQINYPAISLDESIIKKTIYDAFIQKLKFEEPEKESKYLTHLANFGDDERILISSYEEDNYTLSEKTTDELGNEVIKNEVKSIILKLYSPLPANIVQNSTLWITKLMTNPLIETVILNDEKEIEYPYIKGPNFSIDIDFVKGSSTNYESLDDLIISSSSSTKLIQTYLSGSINDTEALNIEYVSGSGSSAQYMWSNFIHFSSAAEKVNNFVYKVQLIENYENLIVSASTDYTGGGNAQWTGSLSAQQEVQRLNTKKSSLIQGFDGFETFLYTSSSYTTDGSGSMTWPYNGVTRIASTNTQVVKWYERVLGLATLYDNGNPNWLINNIPQFIRINPENEKYLLFFSMIGHHFDIIYYYTKAIENSRGMGYKSTGGLSDKLLFDLLKSFNWDAKNLGASDDLWKYLYGEDKDGGTSQSNPVKNRTNEIWRRIINNLPYLLKHKGTRRGIHALMACYGIPASNLSIMEFGGPEITEDTKSKLLVDDTSYALKIQKGQYIGSAGYNDFKTMEIFIKPAVTGVHNVGVDASGTPLVISGSVGSTYGKVSYLDLETPLLPIFNGRYFGISLSDWTSYRELNVIQVESDRLIFSASVTGSASGYDFTGGFQIGDSSPNGFSGSIDEFRLWNQPLSSSIFAEHVFYPEMINGNHISASTTDLDVRYDFEYPKNIGASPTNKIFNVAPHIKLPKNKTRNYYEDSGVTTGLTRLRSTAPYFAESVSGFTNTTTYPYQYEVIQRNAVLEIPDLGSSRYSTNKIRFDSQSLVSDLSPKYRSTKKNIETSPVDSNRVGIFVSPNKELNLDIAKSLGSTNMDDYIGDPSDRYNTSYRPLDKIRKYYFERVSNRDIYEYINLIKSYEKAMFDDIKQMLPARVKATTGLLIEPHFLERSKYQYTKPTGSNLYYEAEYDTNTADIFFEYNAYDTVVNADLSENIYGENNQYQSIVDADLSENLFGENNQFESTLLANDDIQIVGESNNFETIIDAKLDLPTVTYQDLQVTTLTEKNDYTDVGFGIFAQNGAAVRTYYDTDGTLKKERVRVTLVEEQKVKVFSKPRVKIGGRGDSRSGLIETSSVYTTKNLLIQPFSGSVMPQSGSGSIVSAVAVSGYLPTHYRFVSDLTTGMQNSYYKGSKNTIATTLDGSSPVESFISNPNSIKVLPGRSATEPILETDT